MEKKEPDIESELFFCIFIHKFSILMKFGLQSSWDGGPLRSNRDWHSHIYILERLLQELHEQELEWSEIGGGNPATVVAVQTASMMPEPEQWQYETGAYYTE